MYHLKQIMAQILNLFIEQKYLEKKPIYRSNCSYIQDIILKKASLILISEKLIEWWLPKVKAGSR